MTVLAAPAATPRRLAGEDILMRVGIVALAALLLLFIALPLATLLLKSFQDGMGRFVGLSNYGRYFTTPTLVASVWNSLGVALLSTAIVVPLAYLYAYGLTRTCLPGKRMFAALALLPLFAPSLLPAISLIYIFGNQGFLKGWLVGGSIYGPLGIVMAQVFYCFPHALMILITAFSLADGRLYEAAAAMGTPRRRVFWTVTLPGVRYGLISALFVVFTLVITDFGIAKVIGGQFNVLATDAYKQVVGQQNFEMGAVVGFLLLAPAVIAFALDRYVQRRQVALLSARAVPLAPGRNAGRDLAMMLYCLVVGGLIAAVLAVAVWGSFVTYWPYNLSLTLKNYDFETFEPNAAGPYFASLEMASLAAVAGTAVIFGGAYLIEKGRGLRALRTLAHLTAMLPMAVPGLVLGLGYVFFINARWNPLGVLYGSILLLAINSIAHFYTTAHVTALTALKQLDGEFEAVSASLKVPFYRTFARVTVPICLPAILDIAIYLFVNALTTVSAVVFLYGASSKLASISIVHMDEAGATAAAAAMATLIVATALAVKLLHLVLEQHVFAKLQVWRKR
ncbi:MAG TPA: putative 2-aminoethylphosphonate ABC transporter permease subunit [Hyphomicrobiaceae bacterium]|nr:putative 2-aminoethylphosphonate ABC transporter permease subunit [Hyphomicrobiaceae bacterium]